MSFTKNDQAVVLNRESLQYLANCIRLVHSLPDLLNDVLPSQTTTYSSHKVTELLNTLNTDLQNYVNNALGNLSHLKKEIVSVAPTDSSADEDTIYLVQDASGGYEQYLKINGVVTSLGSTSAINNVYTKTESDAKFALLSTLNSLITVVGGLNDLTTTDKTSIVNAINELKTSVTALENKSTMVTLTQAEYNQLVADGTIDNDTYYIISDDSENIDLNKFNIKTYTSLNQLGLTTPISVGDLFVGLPDNSLLRIQCDNDVITGVPHKNGVLIIDKCSSSKFSIEFKISAGGSVNDNTLYIGQLKGVDGTGLTWSRVCTTKVADVGKTNITSRVSNATVNSGGGVSYSVKNGICYVQIQGIATTVASNGQRIIINSNIPNPDYELTNGHYVIASPNATNGLIVFDGKGGIIYYGGAMTIYTTVSYPVKES